MKIRPSELSKAADISLPYASQILSGLRIPSSRVALRAFDNLGCKLGPLAGLTDREIEVVRKMVRGQ